MARTARATAQYRDRRSRGVCVQCGEFSDSQAFCGVHKERNSSMTRLNQKRRIKNGVCRMCPKMALIGRTMCVTHLAKMSARVSGHGATVEDRSALFANQRGLCAICADSLQDAFKAHVDHSHGTGKIRGMLCKRCNATVGLLEYRPWYVDACEQYIDKAAT